MSPIVGFAGDDDLLGPDELELLEEILLDYGLELQELVELEGELTEMQAAVFESHWVQLVGAVELGRVTKAHQEARTLAQLEAKWQANE